MLFTMLGLSASAEQRREVQLIPPSATPAARLSTPWRPGDAASPATRIVGAVFDMRQVPVSYAKVQLRNLGTGVVLATSDTNDMGEYNFDVAEPGTYVVEMLVLDNYVLALSNAVSLRRYETSQTVIRLSGRWDFAARSMFMPASPTAFFGMGAANTMTSSTIALAADADVRPVDAGEPVSPQ
jgi:hypothetical protein